MATTPKIKRTAKKATPKKTPKNDNVLEFQQKPKAVQAKLIEEKKAKVADDTKWNNYANQLSEKFYTEFQTFIVNGIMSELDTESMVKALGQTVAQIMLDEPEKNRDTFIRFFVASTVRGFESQIGIACCGDLGKFLEAGSLHL